MNDLILVVEISSKYTHVNPVLHIQTQSDGSYYIIEPEMYISSLDKLNNKDYLNKILISSCMLDEGEEPTGRYEITKI